MIKIILLSGFLGSGKTTLLNNMLSHMTTEKVAVIVNEYGKEGVDGQLIDSDDFSISEINDGSIFCTCKSDQFIEVILKTKELDVDVIIVENSGLADPMSMSRIMDILEKLSPKTYHYSGSICVVDALNFMKIKEILPVIKNQVKGSNLLILNKVDLVTHGVIIALREELKSMTDTEIIETKHCKITKVENLFKLKAITETQHQLITKTLGISKIHLESSCMTVKGMEQWLFKISHLTLRIKGFILDESSYLVQSVLGDYTIKAYDEKVEPYVEIIMRSHGAHKALIIKEFEKCKTI